MILGLNLPLPPSTFGNTLAPFAVLSPEVGFALFAHLVGNSSSRNCLLSSS